MNILEGNFGILETDMALGLQKLGLILGEKTKKMSFKQVAHLTYQLCRIKSYFIYQCDISCGV